MKLFKHYVHRNYSALDYGAVIPDIGTEFLTTSNPALGAVRNFPFHSLLSLPPPPLSFFLSPLLLSFIPTFSPGHS